MRNISLVRLMRPIGPGNSRSISFSETGATVQIPAWADALAHQFDSEMMDSAELIYLLASLFTIEFTPGDFIVEIGTYHGNTSVLLGKALQQMKRSIPVVAIDPFKRTEARRWNPVGWLSKYLTNLRSHRWNPVGSLSKYLTNLRSHKVEGICFPIVAYSYEAVNVLDNQIALLVVDGDHAYAGVQKDLALFAPKVRVGGLIFADDYVQAYPGVVRAVDEFVASHPNWRLIHRAWFVIVERIA